MWGDDASEGEAEIRSTLSAAGLEPGAMRRVPPSLEDVFTALVRAEGGAVVG